MIYILLTKEIDINWNPANFKHFLSKGYKYTCMGYFFTVKVEDLNIGSRYKVLVACDEECCTNIKKMDYGEYYRKYRNKYSCSVHSQSYYENIAQKRGFTIIGEWNTKKVTVKCSNGHSPKPMSWSNFKKAKYVCIDCFYEKLKLEYEFIKNEFKKRNFELLFFEDCKLPLKYRCPNGHEHETLWNYFQQGCCCPTCKQENFCGENNPRYNPDLTDEERMLKRCEPDYLKWRKEVFDRDKYTCQCCGDNRGGNLVAHHIYNFKDFKELRLCVKNGITFCEECHEEFHYQYEYYNNNEFQLSKFIEDFWKDILEQAN